MIKIAYIILSHENPAHVSTLARCLTDGDPDCTVVIHYDANAKAENFKRLQELTADESRIALVADRVRCGWGDFSLVQATINGLRLIKERGGCDRVMLISGACLPNRPLADLKSFMAANRDREFIECHSSAWITGGMRDDRYRHFHVVNHRRWRRLFNWMDKAQKLARVHRKIPDGLLPRFGSQWWALTWATCLAVLDYIDARPAVPKFFRSTWIPDELFFQTLVWHLVPHDKIGNRSLTFYHFNDWGLPLIFLNDHVELVKSLPFYFVRKICPRASDLRKALVEHARSGSVEGLSPVDPLKKPHFDMRRQALQERDGIKAPTRLFSRLEPQSGDMALADLGRRFVVLYGPEALTNEARIGMHSVSGFTTFGRLFDQHQIKFGHGREDFHTMSDKSAAIRDRYPMTWLKMVLSRAPGIPVFELSPNDPPQIQRALANSSLAIVAPIVPREYSAGISDFYRLLLTRPSEIFELRDHPAPYEYIKRSLLDARLYEPDIAHAIDVLSNHAALASPGEWQNEAVNYRHGQLSEKIKTGLAFANSRLTAVTPEQLLRDYPRPVIDLYTRLMDKRAIWQISIGLDLPIDPRSMETRAKLANRIVPDRNP